MPLDPAYETGDDTIAIGDRVRVPGSGSSFIKDGETGTVIALAGSYRGLQARYQGHLSRLRPSPRHQFSFLSN